jgi:hypothetical protein
VTEKWRPVVITHVEDVVAEDLWEYRHLGQKRVARVAVGRPTPDPSGGDWYCPLFFEHELRGWLPVYGVGPVDALANALTVVRKLFDALAPAPRGGIPKGARRGTPGTSKTASAYAADAPEPTGWAFATFTIEQRRTMTSFGVRWIVCTSIHRIGKTVKASVTIWPPKNLSAERADRLRRDGFERVVTSSLRRIGYRGRWQPTSREGIRFADFWKHDIRIGDVGRERNILDGFSMPAASAAADRSE